jgi:hypothetical protein
VENFNATGAMIWETVFRSSLVADKARNTDVLMLYPMRHVWVSLDKFYPPGNVYGFNVYVWADTGEVCHIQERLSTVDLPEDVSASASEAAFSSQSAVFAIVPCGVLVIGIASLWLRKKKSLCLRRFAKFGGLLLCLLTLSMLSVPIATVSATDPKGRALIWGSESSAAYRKDGAGANTLTRSPTKAWLQRTYITDLRQMAIPLAFIKAIRTRMQI